MSATVPERNRSALPVRAEKCATASLRKAEKFESVPEAIGRTLERARNLRGWTLDELSGYCDRDARQVARWIKGLERTPFDVLFAIEDARWRNALVVALAELGAGVEIDTVIRLRIKESA